MKSLLVVRAVVVIKLNAVKYECSAYRRLGIKQDVVKKALIVLVPLIGIAFDADKTAAQSQRAFQFVVTVDWFTVFTQP